MSPPLCLHCHLEPVGRVYGRLQRQPYRFIDGVAWRNYCSQRCANAATKDSPSRRRLLSINRERYIARVKARLVADAAALLAGPPITGQALCRFAWQCERRGYLRGFAAAWAQKRRKALA